MTILTIYPTRNFIKAFKKLPKEIHRFCIEKEKNFKANPHDQRLKTHRLKGDLDGYWSYSINHQYRILFKFINQHDVIYFDIGTHEIYR